MLNAKVHMFAGRDRSRPTTRNLPLQSLNLADFEFNRDVRCRAQMRMKEKAGTRMVIAPAGFIELVRKALALRKG